MYFGQTLKKERGEGDPEDPGTKKHPAAVAAVVAAGAAAAAGVGWLREHWLKAPA